MSLEDLTGHQLGFVIANAPTPSTGGNAGEVILRTRLIAAGATVNFVSDDGPAMGTTITAGNGYTGFLFSEGALSTNIGTQLATSTLPGLQGKAFTWDDHNIATTPGSLAAQTAINVTNTSHYIATNSGLASGSNTLHAVALQINYCTGFSAGPTTIAHIVGQATQILLAAIEPGAALGGGSPATAPARRACFSAWSSAMTLNALGLEVFDACINWMLGFDGGAPQDITVNPLDGSPSSQEAVLIQSVQMNALDGSPTSQEGILEVNQAVTVNALDGSPTSQEGSLDGQTAGGGGTGSHNTKHARSGRRFAGAGRSRR